MMELPHVLLLSVLLSALLAQSNFERCTTELRKVSFAPLGQFPLVRLTNLYTKQPLASSETILKALAYNHAKDKLIGFGSYTNGQLSFNSVIDLPEDFSCRGASFLVQYDNNLVVRNAKQIEIVGGEYSRILFDKKYESFYLVANGDENNNKRCEEEESFYVGNYFRYDSFPLLFRFNASSFEAISRPTEIVGISKIAGAVVDSQDGLIVIVEFSSELVFGEVKLNNKTGNVNPRVILRFSANQALLAPSFYYHLRGDQVEVSFLKILSDDSLIYVSSCTKESHCTIIDAEGASFAVSKQIIIRTHVNGTIVWALEYDHVSGLEVLEGEIFVLQSEKITKLSVEGAILFEAVVSLPYASIVTSRTPGSIFISSTTGLLLQISTADGQVLSNTTVVAMPYLTAAKNGSVLLYGSTTQSIQVNDGEEDIWLTKKMQNHHSVSYIMKYYQNCSCAEQECVIPMCGGKKPYTPGVCNNLGQCVAPDKCMCKEGEYDGENCDITLCYGIPHTDPTVCSGRGICDAPNTCVCHHQYRGDKCELSECFSQNSDTPGVCTSNGECIAKDLCKCSYNFTDNSCYHQVQRLSYCSVVDGSYMLHTESEVSTIIPTGMQIDMLPISDKSRAFCQNGTISVHTSQTILVNGNAYTIVAINSTGEILWKHNITIFPSDAKCTENTVYISGSVLGRIADTELGFIGVYDLRSGRRIAEHIMNCSFSCIVNGVAMGIDNRIYITGKLSGRITIAPSCMVSTRSKTQTFVASLVFKDNTFTCEWILSSKSWRDYGVDIHYHFLGMSTDIFLFGQFSALIGFELLQSQYTSDDVTAQYMLKASVVGGGVKFNTLKKLSKGPFITAHDNNRVFWMASNPQDYYDVYTDESVNFVCEARMQKIIAILRMDSQGFVKNAVCLTARSHVHLGSIYVDPYSGSLFITGATSDSLKMRHYTALSQHSVTVPQPTATFDTRMFVMKLTMEAAFEWVQYSSSDGSIGYALSYQPSHSSLFAKGCVMGSSFTFGNRTLSLPMTTETLCNAVDVQILDDERCIKCSRGTYLETRGLISTGKSICTPCPKGAYCPEEGMKEPLACKAFQVSEIGSTYCQSCPFGHYYEDANNGSCTRCLILSNVETKAECEGLIATIILLAILGSILVGLCLLALVLIPAIAIIQYRSSRKSLDTELLLLPIGESDKTGPVLSIHNQMFEIPFSELKLLKEVGQGASGTLIMKASWKKQIVAVKVLRISVNSEEFLISQFERELNLLASLRHPNIVNFYGIAFDMPKVAMVLEFCDNGNLADYLMQNKGKLTWDQKVHFALDIANGMAFLHSKHVIHRDLKAENVLVDKHGTAKITDFGVSTITSAKKERMTMGIGTGYYMAPEICKGESYDEKADVFSFGIILYELLEETLKPYGEVVNVMEVQVKVATVPEFRPKLHPGSHYTKVHKLQDKELMEEYLKLVQRCWHYQSSMRPTFAEIINILETFD